MANILFLTGEIEKVTRKELSNGSGAYSYYLDQMIDDVDSVRIDFYCENDDRENLPEYQGEKIKKGTQLENFPVLFSVNQYENKKGKMVAFPKLQFPSGERKSRSVGEEVDI